MKPTKQIPVVEVTTNINQLSGQQLRWLRDKYNVQKKTQSSRCLDANGHHVQVTMSFDEWLDVWIQSGKLNLRGRGAGKFCMARHLDLGDYAVGNVSIKPCEVNSRDAKQGRPGLKGRVSPTKGMTMSTKPCAHCGKQRSHAVLARWHGGNCGQTDLRTQ